MPGSTNGCTRRISREKQVIEGGAGPCGICRNCKIEDSRIETRADWRRFARQTRIRRELINLAFINIFKIRDQCSKELNLRAVEEKLKKPAFMPRDIIAKKYYTTVVKRYRDFVGDDADFQEKEGDSDTNIQKEKDE